MRTHDWIAPFALVLLACSAPTADGRGSGAPDGATAVDDDASADTRPPPPETVDGYPVGPFGLHVGQVFPNVTLQGYVGGKRPWQPIALRDYFDPDGSRGIRGLLVMVSAPWCSGCKAAGASYPNLYRTEYAPKGARFLAAIVEDTSMRPATEATVDAWVTSYATNYDIAADPELVTIRMSPTESGSLSLPYDYVIDPRTMRIVQIDSGAVSYGAQIPGLDELLKRNGS